MGARLNTLVANDQETIRDNILRVERAGLIARGVTSPNVTPGSDAYVRATALANELAVVEANSVIAADRKFPDTATGQDLLDICAPYGLSKRSAGGSVGPITFSASAASLVSTGQQLVDGAGLRYQVAVGGTYSDGDTIPVAAVDTGNATNLVAGSSIRWQVAPPFSSPTGVVGIGGLVNGVDAEDDEALRARLLARLQVAPAGGNWQHVAQIAEASSPTVQKAFVYPAIQGPATYHVAVAAAPTTTNKSRQVASSTLTGTITPYIAGLLPEHAYSVVTTVANTNADVVIGLNLPSAATASPSGPGGGWLDGTPWPSVDGASFFRVTVTAVTSTTQFTVDAQTAPTDGVSRIAWLSPTTWTLYTATVIASSGNGGAYVINLDTPFVGITTGCYIWPQCANQNAYVRAILAAFQLMGPGEKTSNGSALVRGFRHPTPATSWSSTLGPQMLKSVELAGDEVLATQFLHRTDGTTTTTGSAGIVTPQVPGAVTSAPNIYVPRHIAFLRIA